MRVLVTGASGFVGSLLVPRLLAEGHSVRALGRDPERVARALALTPRRAGAGAPEIVRGDALTGEGLADALREIEVAYYLIHSMESPSAPGRPTRPSPRGSAGHPHPAGSFPERERIAADRFGRAAARAGVRRIVYLGGLLPTSAEPASQQGAVVGTRASRHLASRAEVERILLEAVPDSVALRASIVIGARSRSFRLLVHLVERLPVLALPAWRRYRTQPIDERDIAEMLMACAGAPVEGRSLDVAGPDMLSYEEMMIRIAELMLVNRPVLGLGVSLTPVAARVAAAIAGEDPELVLPLMEGLHGDLLAGDDHAAELLNVDLHSFDASVEHALGEWEKSETLAAR
jgi:uncharacterized protein YbjT (DUF2867 family)